MLSMICLVGTTHATESGRDSSLIRRYLLSTVVSEAYVEPTLAGIDCTGEVLLFIANL